MHDTQDVVATSLAEEPHVIFLWVSVHVNRSHYVDPVRRIGSSSAKYIDDTEEGAFLKPVPHKVCVSLAPTFQFEGINRKGYEGFSIVYLELKPEWRAIYAVKPPREFVNVYPVP